MPRYSEIDYKKTLARLDVQDYLVRRGEGLCVGGCGKVVPLKEDSEWWDQFFRAVGGSSLKNIARVESRFLHSHWSDDGETYCGYRSVSMQNSIDPESGQYNGRLTKVVEFLTSHEIERRNGVWQFI